MLVISTFEVQKGGKRWGRKISEAQYRRKIGEEMMRPWKALVFVQLLNRLLLYGIGMNTIISQALFPFFFEIICTFIAQKTNLCIRILKIKLEKGEYREQRVQNDFNIAWNTGELFKGLRVDSGYNCINLWMQDNTK